MSRTASPLLISVSVTLTSMIIAIISFFSLQSQEGTRHRILASFPLAPVTYTLKETPQSTTCLGSIHVDLDTGGNQASLSMTGWMMVSMFGQQEPIELEATLLFNALGQLSISMFKATTQHESVRLATKGVNPMTVQVYRKAVDSRPLLNQTIPGPIELHMREHDYEIVAPMLPAFQNLAKTSSLPVTFERTDTTSCERGKARALDMTPYLHMAATLSENLRKMMPGL
jgi:hypothetical protein